MPRTHKQRLRYGDIITLDYDPGAGGNPYVEYRANGVHDPDYTNVGHQPYGFDQWAALYQRAVVIGSAIRVSYLPITANIASLTPALWWISKHRLGDPTPVVASYDDLLEQPWHGKPQINGVTGTRRAKSTLRFSARKDMHVTVPLEDHGINVKVENNPSSDKTMLYRISAGQVLGGTDPYSVTLSVEIEYIAVFNNPRLLGES